MNLSEAQNGTHELRHNLNLLTSLFHNASESAERHRLLTSMTIIMEELRKHHQAQSFIQAS